MQRISPNKGALSFYDAYFVFMFSQTVVASYNKQGSMTADEAKLGFLKAVSRWPTFGCAFFEVKVTAGSFILSSVIDWEWVADLSFATSLTMQGLVQKLPLKNTSVLFFFVLFLANI